MKVQLEYVLMAFVTYLPPGCPTASSCLSWLTRFKFNGYY
jgi:hypothetical protein